MAPSGGRTTARTRRNSPNLKLKKMKKTKKQQQLPAAPPNDIVQERRSDWSDFDGGLETASSGDLETAIAGGCSTPRAERFRIPEILTCPPAPKKQRAVSDCSFRRSPIAFFAPPELELFFFFALPDISV